MWAYVVQPGKFIPLSHERCVRVSVNGASVNGVSFFLRTIYIEIK